MAKQAPALVGAAVTVTVTDAGVVPLGPVQVKVYVSVEVGVVISEPPAIDLEPVQSLLVDEAVQLVALTMPDQVNVVEVDNGTLVGEAERDTVGTVAVIHLAMYPGAPVPTTGPGAAPALKASRLKLNRKTMTANIRRVAVKEDSVMGLYIFLKIDIMTIIYLL